MFFTRRFYILFVSGILLLVASYALPFLFIAMPLLLGGFALTALADYLFLFSRRNPVKAGRIVAERLSNGDINPVRINIRSDYPFSVRASVIDEIPFRFQQRNFNLPIVLTQGREVEISYTLQPAERGEYRFHDINVFVRSPLGLVIRRIVAPAEQTVKVYPAFFILRQYSLNGHRNNLLETGNKKVRKLGQSLEFEQIREYVTGDDIRNINWKATARKGGHLMLNSYTDERSQQVYCFIDKSRVMQMPFEGMSLLDYAINAAVLLSHVALIKQDRAGLVCFAENIDTFLPAGRKMLQMNSILQALYAQQTSFPETDFEKLYAFSRTRIPQRSLVLLFTNFESFSGFQRQLPFIKSIARNHLLVVVFFENTELKELASRQVESTEDLYIKTIAEKFIHEKKRIVKELQKQGILSVLTTPKNLSVSTINKYLEVKARQGV